MITVLVETTIDLVIEGEILLRFHTDESDPASTRKMPVYLSIFALAQYVFLLLCDVDPTDLSFSVFQFIMAIDAVYARNTLQFICLT